MRLKRINTVVAIESCQIYSTVTKRRRYFCLEGKKLLTGCHSKIILPLDEPSIDGDDWILNRFKSSNNRINSDFMDDYVGKSLVIQTLLTSHQELRNMQSNLKHNYPKRGTDWVEEYLTLMNSVSLPDNQLKSSSRLRILTPDQAIGCSADLIIMTNLSSSSWDMRVPKLPFIGKRNDTNSICSGRMDQLEKLDIS